MIISHTNKFIFFKAPKVAGTSTEIFFEQFCNKDKDIIGLRGLKESMPKDTEYWNHMSPVLMKQKMLPQDWQTYLKFGNVRNPWDRMVSSYFFKKELRGWPSLQGVSFEQFVRDKEHKHPKSLYKYYCIDSLQKDYKNNMYFIRYENLHEDILKICDMLNLKPKEKLQHIKKANRNTDYKNYYNKETKRIVQKRYGHDIRLFNYTY